MHTSQFQTQGIGKSNESMPGRQRQVVDLLSLFQTSQLIGLFGENGSGKTSLITHGLIPELNKGFLGIAGRKWKSILIRPGITPLENLSAGISQLSLEGGKQKLEEEVQLVTKMRASNEGLKNACLKQFPPQSTQNALLIIDNFEDLFQFREVATHPSDWDEVVKSFIQNISKCASNASIPVYFLVVLRSDYMARLFEYRNFYEMLSASQYNLPQFRKTEFSEVVKSILLPYQKTISKDAHDLLYLHLGKDLKNLTLLKFYLQEAVEATIGTAQDEIQVEILEQVAVESLYSKRLESFISSCSDKENKLIERLFKQITVIQEGAKLRKPIRIDHFLQVTGTTLSELAQLLQTLQLKFHFLLDVVLPYQERLEVKEHALLSESSVIDIKNEQFIPHWPRLVEWIKEEKESQDLYKRLSEKATLFDKGLTDFLKPPDLDLALAWYEHQQPDELWSNQFDSNHHRTIAYLLNSKLKFQEEISKRELEQKEKLKRLRRGGIYGILVASVVVLVFVFLFLQAKEERKIAKIAESEAYKAQDKAEREAEIAKMQKARADSLTDRSDSLYTSAINNFNAALAQKEIADGLTKQVERERDFLKMTTKSLEEEQLARLETQKNLIRSNDQLEITNKEVLNAKAYQESLNTILSLRNQLQKSDLEEEELNELFEKVEVAYSNYRQNSIAFKSVVLPNNDLYQVLLALRKKFIDKGTIKALPEEARPSGGLRKITVSTSGAVAAGGDDGVLLYAKPGFAQGTSFSKFSIGRDRIRSLEFINASELLIGTVSGRVLQYSPGQTTLKNFDLGLASNQIVDQILATSKGVFVLSNGVIMKFDPNVPNSVTRVPSLSVKNLFKLSEDKLLVVGQDNTLIQLDITSLQWQPISSNLRRGAVTAAISWRDKLFLGMESGDVVACKIIKLGNVISFRSELNLQAHRTRITSLAYDAVSEKLFSASLDQTASIYDLKLSKFGEEMVSTNNYKIEGFDKWIWDFALIQVDKTKLILTVDESGKLKSWLPGSEMIFDEIVASKTRK